MSLKALRPVLYQSTQYKAGDDLPGGNADMVAAWIESGSAAWTDADPEPEPEKPKAKPAAAPSGIPGKSYDSYDGELVGKVPQKGRRKK